MTATKQTTIHLMLATGVFTIPGWVTDHPKFLEWLRTTDVPDDMRVSYLDHVIVEPAPERTFAHNRIKDLVAVTLMPIAPQDIYFGTGLTYSSLTAGFTTVPDGIFVRGDFERTGRVRLEDDTYLFGSPELILEVVGDDSEQRASEWLRSGYWRAGVDEYWRVDARIEPVKLHIYRRRVRGYIASRQQNDGWMRSDVFDRDFRFVPAGTVFGRTDYDFEVR